MNIASVSPVNGRFYEDFFDSVPIGFIICRSESQGTRPNLRLVDFNRTAAAVAGRDLRPLVGRELDGVFASDLVDPVVSLVEEVRRSGAGSDIRVIHASGEETGFHAYAVRAFPLPDDFAGVAFQEITDRILAERRLERSGEDLRALTGHLVTVREQERARIAREIHDELGQALTAIKLDLSWLRWRLARRDRRTPRRQILDRLTDMSRLVDDTVKTVSRIAADLRPSMLDRLGIGAAIEWQAGEFQARTGIRCRVESSLGDEPAAGDASTAIFRIFQETLTNVARHAAATEVGVRLARSRRSLLLIVLDNGLGISDEAIVSPKSLGLLGMRERALLAGGTVKVSRVPGSGTLVRARIPAAGA